MIPDPAVQPVMTAEQAFAELGIDRTTGYRAIREGTFPVEVIRVGRLIRVPTYALWRLLSLAPPPSQAGSAELASGPPVASEHADASRLPMPDTMIPERKSA